MESKTNNSSFIDTLTKNEKEELISMDNKVVNVFRTIPNLFEMCKEYVAESKFSFNTKNTDEQYHCVGLYKDIFTTLSSRTEGDKDRYWDPLISKISNEDVNYHLRNLFENEKPSTVIAMNSKLCSAIDKTVM